MQCSSISDIYTCLQDILANEKNDAPETLGAYVVGCTIVPDDIESYYKEYPILEEIAELGSDLEIANYEKGKDGYYYIGLIRDKVIELKQNIKV